MTSTSPNRARRLTWRPTLVHAITLVTLAALTVAGLGSLASAQSTNCTNLVGDSSFESGANWQTATNGSYALIGNFATNSGAKAAHLAGVDNAQDKLALALNLPADKPTVTLDFWWMLQSEEESGEFDGMTVLIADAAGNALQSLLTVGSESASSQWQQSSLDLSAFAGQAIQLQFVAQTDETLVTDFFVDDVSVTACGASANFQVFLPLTQR